MNVAAILRRVPVVRELCIVAGVLSFLILMPIVAVFIVSDSGVAAVSASLIQVNPTDHSITVYDAAGHVKTHITAKTVWPVAGVITLGFGQDDSPYQLHHTGMDIADPTGKIGRPITVFMAGVVSKVVNVDNPAGRYVFVDHGYGIQSQYWHLSEALVSVGQTVVPGDVIGLEGMTGYATGPHLHFQIDVNGVPVDPHGFIAGEPAQW